MWYTRIYTARHVWDYHLWLINHHSYAYYSLFAFFSNFFALSSSLHLQLRCRLLQKFASNNNNNNNDDDDNNKNDINNNNEDNNYISKNNSMITIPASVVFRLTYVTPRNHALGSTYSKSFVLCLSVLSILSVVSIL